MATLISLREVADALDSLSDESETFLDPDTGEIVMITEEERRLVETNADVDRLPEWQREMLPKIRDVLESNRYLLLPDKFEVHEWSIMDRFARSQNDERARRELVSASHGCGAFRMFKATVQRLGLEATWYAFRDEALKEIARAWLEEHNLKYK